MGGLLKAIHLNDAVLDTYYRNNREQALFNALSDIEMAARKAQERLNDLRYGRGLKAPAEQMGT